MRISSPPITHPDFYGIDTPDQDKLLAAHRTLEEMREFIGADSLEFLSVDGIYKAMGYRRPRQRPSPIHRPLLHRRISDAPQGPRRPAAAEAALLPRRGRLTAKRLKDRIALITGASRGIGRASRRNSRRRARMFCCSPATARPWNGSTTRSGPPAARPRSFRSISPTANPSTRSAPRSMSASAGSTCWSAMPPYSGASRP